MIGVKFQGRMGNQLFQYAFAYAYAKKANHSFFIDGNKKKNKLNYFLLKGKNVYGIQNYLKKIRLFNKKIFCQYGNENTDEVLRALKSYNYFDGYFQSETFFKDYEIEIKEVFEIKIQYKNMFKEKYEAVFKNNQTIVIHIRQTDYLTWEIDKIYGGVNPSLPFSYVETFLSNFNLEDYKVFFISDDIEVVKRHFGANSNFFFESNNEIVDFQLLVNADVLCLSNSTYAWWGAYLNPKAQKKIYAPQYWLGYKTGTEYPVDIICKSWKTIQIN